MHTADHAREFVVIGDQLATHRLEAVTEFVWEIGARSAESVFEQAALRYAQILY